MLLSVGCINNLRHIIAMRLNVLTVVWTKLILIWVESYLGGGIILKR